MRTSMVGELPREGSEDEDEVIRVAMGRSTLPPLWWRLAYIYTRPGSLPS